jgi:hypothetical protein
MVKVRMRKRGQPKTPLSEADLVARTCTRIIEPLRGNHLQQSCSNHVFLYPIDETEEWGLFSSNGFKKGDVIFDNVAMFDITHDDFLNRMHLGKRKVKCAPSHIYHFVSQTGLVNTDDVDSPENVACMWAYIAEHICWFINSVLPDDNAAVCNVAFDVVRKSRTRTVSMKIVAIQDIAEGEQLLESYLLTDEQVLTCKGRVRQR